MKRPIVVNRRFDRYDVYIGRDSQWGNPYKIGVHGNREQVIEKYREMAERAFAKQDLAQLAGKRLGCYCVPLACHGDVLADMVEAL